MWTEENRGRYDRSRLRYPSDLTEAEWGLVRPLIPPCKRGGRQRTIDLQEVVNGLMYVLSTGCQWRAVPRICRHAARCTTTLVCGAGTARWTVCTTRSTSPAASRRGERPARQRPLSTTSRGFPLPSATEPLPPPPERQERRKRGRRSIRTATTPARRSKAEQPKVPPAQQVEWLRR